MASTERRILGHDPLRLTEAPTPPSAVRVARLAPTFRSPLAAAWRAGALWRDATLWQTFAATAAARPSHPAVIDGATRLDFAALAARAADGAGGLAALGVRAGDRVALVLPAWWEAIVALLAIARLGAVAVPLLPIHRHRELAFALAQSAARVCVTAAGASLAVVRDLRAQLPALEAVLVARGEAGPGEAPWPPPAPASPSPPVETPACEVAVLLHTSGTTAEPKGVLHTHETLLAEARSLGPVHQLGPHDVALVPSSTGHIAGIVHGLLVPSVYGATAVLLDRWTADRALAVMAAEGVTYTVGAPVLLRELASHPARAAFDLSRFRLFSCGGAAVDPALLAEAADRLGCVAKRVYGSTEFPTIATTGPDDPPARCLDSDGRAIDGAEIRIVAADGREAACGEEGEILARGPDCCVGYLDPARTAESFTADGWFRTGDLGRVDRAGFLRVTGRLKDVIIRKGENISAAEVEALLATHPAVAEVAVVGLPDAAAGEIACAVVVPRRGGPPPTLESLGVHLRAQGLSTRKLPERLEVVDALPRTASGKVQKSALRERLTRPG